nr:hypothetical protein MmNV_17 [Menippe mercenaria nudivirus]
MAPSTAAAKKRLSKKTKNMKSFNSVIANAIESYSRANDSQLDLLVEGAIQIRKLEKQMKRMKANLKARHGMLHDINKSIHELKLIQNASSFLECLVCSICKTLLHKPVKTKCGHKFCADCMERWGRESRTCPVCRGTSLDLKNLDDELVLGNLNTLTKIITTHFRPEEMENVDTVNMQIFHKDDYDGVAGTSSTPNVREGGVGVNVGVGDGDDVSVIVNSDSDDELPNVNGPRRNLNNQFRDALNDGDSDDDFVLQTPESSVEYNIL